MSSAVTTVQTLGVGRTGASIAKRPVQWDHDGAVNDTDVAATIAESMAIASAGPRNSTSPHDPIVRRRVLGCATLPAMMIVGHRTRIRSLGGCGSTVAPGHRRML
jgi:hypothetical protein